MWIQRTSAFIIGTGSLVVGVMRFTPIEGLEGWETAEPLHGVLHLATATTWMVAAWYQSGRYAETVNKTLGVFWLVVGTLGTSAFSKVWRRWHSTTTASISSSVQSPPPSGGVNPP